MRYLICLVALLALGCGGESSPTAPTPTPPAAIGGNWQGTWTYTPISGGQRTVTAMTMQITQSSDTVNGTFQVTGGISGSVTGTVTPSSFSGSFTIQGHDTLGRACTGQGILSGSATGTQLRWSNPTINSNDCTWFSQNELVLAR